MTRRDDTVFLVDMLNHAREAVELLGNAGPDDLKSDRVTQLALRKLVEVVGEAANRVSPMTRQRYPEIAWPQIIGARNRLVHGYDVVNLTTLQDIVRNDLPMLIEQLTSIVGKDPTSSQPR